MELTESERARGGKKVVEGGVCEEGGEVGGFLCTGVSDGREMMVSLVGRSIV